MFLRCSLVVALWVFINCTNERGEHTPMKYNNGKSTTNKKLLSTGKHFPASARNDENIKFYSKDNEGSPICQQIREKAKANSTITKKHSNIVDEMPLIGNRYSDIWNRNGSEKCREKLSKSKENCSNFIGKVRSLLNKKSSSDNNLKMALLDSESSSDSSNSEKPLIREHRFTDILYESENYTNFSNLNRESDSRLMEKTLSNENRFTDILFGDENENAKPPLKSRSFEKTTRSKSSDKTHLPSYKHDYSNHRFTDILFEDETQNRSGNRNRMKSLDRSQSLSYNKRKIKKSPSQTRHLENKNRSSTADTTQSYTKSDRFSEDENKKSPSENLRGELKIRSNSTINRSQSLSRGNKDKSIGGSSEKEKNAKSPLKINKRENKKQIFIRKSNSLSNRNCFNLDSAAIENPRKRYNHILLDDDTSTVVSSEYSRLGSKNGLNTFQRSQSLTTTNNSSLDRYLRVNFSDKTKIPVIDSPKNETPTLTSERFFNILRDIENLKSITGSSSGETSKTSMNQKNSSSSDKKSFLNMLGIKKSKDPALAEKSRILEILHDVEKLEVPAECKRKIRGSMPAERGKDDKSAEHDKRNINRNQSINERSNDENDEKLSSVVRGMGSLSLKKARFLDTLRENENLKILLQNLTTANKAYYKQIGRNVNDKFKKLDDMIPTMELNTLTKRTYVALNNYHFPSEQTLKRIRSFLNDKYYDEYMKGKALEENDFEKKNLKSICEDIKAKTGLSKDPYESQLSSICTIKSGRCTQLINHQSGECKSFLLYGICHFTSEIRIMLAHVDGNKRYYFLGIYFGKGVVVIADHFTESFDGTTVIRDFYAE